MTTNPNVRFSQIDDLYGSGGRNVAPQDNGDPSMRESFRTALASVAAPYADTTAMQASLAKDRVDGQFVIRLSDYSLWTWEAGDTTAADATHIAPTDLGGGAGRFVAVATTPVADATPSADGLMSAADKTKLDSLQAGTSTLVNGVSGNISATLTATSRIVALRKDIALSTAIGVLAAKSADRATGSPGHFKITAQKTADGTTETGDQSTFDWFVLG